MRTYRTHLQQIIAWVMRMRMSDVTIYIQKRRSHVPYIFKFYLGNTQILWTNFVPINVFKTLARQINCSCGCEFVLAIARAAIILCTCTQLQSEWRKPSLMHCCSHFSAHRNKHTHTHKLIYNFSAMSITFFFFCSIGHINKNNNKKKITLKLCRPTSFYLSAHINIWARHVFFFCLFIDGGGVAGKYQRFYHIA